ncbi:MAG: hypothetical protein KUG51_01605, partial [Urechidicola sp.]|nr:hypothetical protein [Urechidicola sp.]
EHIDDSVYTLSMRQPKIGTSIFKDLSDVHYYIDESLIHFSDNQFNNGLSDQQFVMTSTNNIAFLLSNILNSLQNASPSMGQGQGDSFGLPDIIKKQEDAIGKMEDGIKQGQKPGQKNLKDGNNSDSEKNKQSGAGRGEQMSGDLYEIYKEQAEMRRMLEQALKDQNSSGNEAGKEVLEQMEQLEKDLLENGYTNNVLQKMIALKLELLKLNKASYYQGIESKRKSYTGSNNFENRNIKDINSNRLRYNENEILNRQSLPLRTPYKIRAQEYFKSNDSIQ